MTLPDEVREVLEGKRRWAVVCADNREILPLLPERAVGVVLTDPPYSRDLYLRFRTNKGARGNDAKSVQSRNHLALANFQIGAVEDVLSDVAPELLRVTSRWVVVFHDAESGHLWREAFGVAYVRSGVWVKPNPVPQISGDRPGQGFESITIAHRGGRKRWNGGGRPAVWICNSVNANPIANDRAENSHPCPKPVPLMLSLVEDFTDPDEVILEPFAGSGTTGIAALRLGRRCILIERDPAFAQLARERLSAESQGLSLRDARAGQLPLLGGAL